MDHDVILFDFNGVLCHDRFYSNMTEVQRFIESHVFSKTSSIPDKWMRAEMNMNDVNRFISDNTGVGYDELSCLFLESIRDMQLDQRLLEFAQELGHHGKKVGIVTDNMDVFTTITIPHKRLNEIFPVIVNSFDYGMMKKDGGKLFDIALEQFGLSSYENACLIDDSEKAGNMFESKGGKWYHYTTLAEFNTLIQSK